MNDIPTYLITQGALGIGCLVLGYVCIKLYGKTERQQLRIEQLQDLRLADSKDNTKDVTEVLQANSNNMRILSEKIEVVSKTSRSN